MGTSAATRRTAVVLAGGDPPPPGALEGLPRDTLFVAADSGAAHALAAGLTIDRIVGDLDSIAPADLDAATRSGAVVERHPADKDATDLELAIAAARDLGAQRIVVVGIGGGRLDHFLANVLLLASPEFDALDIEARVGTAAATIVRRSAELRGEPGALVTLLPLGGPARSVHTEGLRWTLRGEDLAPGSSRGVSNELVGTVARVSITGGVLLVVMPGGE